MVLAPRRALEIAFGALIPLQPIAWTETGLLCAPRHGGAYAQTALSRCPFPTSIRPEPRVWPDSTSALVAGWYRRTDHHAPPPPGFPELIQVAGDGFGPVGHITTELCLRALDLLPACDAVDVGCGSGLLGQAWARRHGRRVLAIDADPAAVRQARASIERADLQHLVDVVRGPLEALTPTHLAERALFANLPVAAHRALLDRLIGPPPAVVLSGLRPVDAPGILRNYLAHGMRRVHVARRAGFECHTLLAIK